MSGLTARFSPPSAMAKLRYTGPGSAGPAALARLSLWSQAPLTVVEGSYSLHPSLRDRYQLRVWVEAPWEVRRTRLERRDPGCVDRFLNIWVPLEDHYFQACHVKDCCQIHCSGQ